MAITYPLTPPSSPAPKSISFSAESQVGFQRSPFTGEQTTYAHSGDWFEIEVALPPMARAAAEDWIAFLLALNGREGTFLLGDPVGAAPRGTWTDGFGSPSPSVSGAHAAGVKTVALRDLTNGATVKAGDWIQFGSGATASLHKVVQNATVSGNTVSIEIWPRTKAALAGGATFLVNNTVGLWRLSENSRKWSIEEAQLFGISFSAVQAF